MPIDIKKNVSLRLTIYISTIAIVYFGLVSLLIYVEKDSTQSALTNYSNAFWYSIVTLTTVGYGDLFPATLYGRVIGGIFIITSLGIFGVLIGKLTTLMTTIKENKKFGHNGTSFNNHAVIIGWNEFGWHVIDQLVGANKLVAVVTDNKEDIEHIQEKYSTRYVFILYSDYNNFELIKKTNIRESSIVFINLTNDTEKLVYVLNLKKYFPYLELVVILENGDLRGTFLQAGVSKTISIKEISSKLLASYMFEPDVANYCESIMSFAQSEGDYDIKQLLIIDKNPYVGKQYQDVFYDLKKCYNAVLIGITKQDKYGKRKLIKNPMEDLKITPGDYLILILNGKAFNLMKRVFEVEEGYISEKND